MGITNTLFQSFYMDSAEVCDAANCICTVMESANGCIREADGLLCETFALTARVPAKVRCSELITICENAQTGIRKTDFLDYKNRVSRSMFELVDYCESVVNEMIKGMEDIKGRINGIRNTTTDLNDLIALRVYTRYPNRLSGNMKQVLQENSFTDPKNERKMTLQELRKIYNQENESEFELTTSYIAAKLAGIDVSSNGTPSINSGVDYQNYIECYRNFEEGKYADSYVAAKLAKISISKYGTPSINNAVDAEKYNQIMNQLKQLHMMANRPDTPFYNYTREMVSQITDIDPSLESEIQDFVNAYKNNEDIYIELSKKTGLPPEVIAVIHYRENTTDYLNGDFKVYLHNGQSLGEVTTVYPEDILLYDFEEAAIDAIESQRINIDKYHLTSDSDDIVAMICFLEAYNGLGYYYNDHVSPYSYSGTNLYVSGKYVEENGNSFYHEEVVDEQIGSYALLNAIMEE